ncbi:MAG: hypothetical protein IJO63_05480 [Bacilli bacterium]|nr:hypothetical protein [Bacilli bacterium]
MRDAIGSTWVFALVIVFTLIFSGFLVLALSYSRAYKVKNEMTSIIERYEGITTNDNLNGLGSIGIINQYLQNSKYKAQGKCEYGDYATNDLDPTKIELVTQSNAHKNFYYCIKVNHNAKQCSTRFTITVFYNFNLPILGQLGKYQISGQTNEVHDAYILGTPISC